MPVVVFDDQDDDFLFHLRTVLWRQTASLWFRGKHPPTETLFLRETGFLYIRSGGLSQVVTQSDAVPYLYPDRFATLSETIEVASCEVRPVRCFLLTGDVDRTVPAFNEFVQNVLRAPFLAYMPHLFERFYRVPEQTSNVRGTGLGLYICRKIIEAHSGEIGVESTEGVGTRIFFTLPIEVMEPIPEGEHER